MGHNRRVRLGPSCRFQGWKAPGLLSWSFNLQSIGLRVKANEVLLSATDVMQDRGAIYGHPKINQARIAQRLSCLFDMPIEDYKAALAMVEVKLARIAETPHHIDSYIDACAYLAIACELITEEDELYV